MIASSIRKMTESDLQQLLEWRNNPEIRRWMFNQDEVGMVEHQKWFELCSSDRNRHLLIYEQNGLPAGFASLSEGSGKVAEWGFYVAPQSPKGTGLGLGRSVLNHAFKVLELHKICGQVLDFNNRSRNFHLRLGFKHEGVLREQHFDGHCYRDVYNYGLLSAEWIRSDGGLK